VEAEESGIDWIEFRNFHYWWTDEECGGAINQGEPPLRHDQGL
jgi:hypothetical protein